MVRCEPADHRWARIGDWADAFRQADADFRTPRVRPQPRHAESFADAVAALVLAVASLFVWPLAILAVVYGLAALHTSREQHDRNQPVDRGPWMAVAAVAISVVAVPLVIYGVVFV